MSRPAQSLQVSPAATITVQRDDYTSAAAPKPKPKPKPAAQVQAASVAVGTGQGWLLPVAGRISSAFGPRPNAPVAGVSSFHKGADIAAPCGQPVRAAQAGTVIEAGYQGSYGNWVLIDHGNGIQTGYAHNSQNVVSKGQRVAAGATVALVGSTGASSGCHVHFETRVGGAQVDPVSFMSSWGIRLG
ncbi:M23 family metallopeptidase [Cryobacterium tagatosivorans]|nr:M23 family metallopeptidase [Cryobacterium tagatosivorans]